MKKNFKLLTISFIIALTLATPQQSHATAHESADIHKASKRIKLSHGTEATVNQQPVNKVYRPFNIHTYMAVSLGLTNLHMGPIYHSTPKLAVYPRFLNGKLIYKDPLNGKVIELKFSDLPNSLKGTFDLSECGEASKYLVITTDPSFGAVEVNKDMAVILITLCSLVKQQINSTASHFEPIIGEWNEESAPVGIFWRWGNWEDLTSYDYLTTVSPDDLSSMNLFENWRRPHTTKHRHPLDTPTPGQHRSTRWTSPVPWSIMHWHGFAGFQSFSCSFVNQNKNY